MIDKKNNPNKGISDNQYLEDSVPSRGELIAQTQNADYYHGIEIKIKTAKKELETITIEIEAKIIANDQLVNRLKKGELDSGGLSLEEALDKGRLLEIEKKRSEMGIQWINAVADFML
ncbi:hypothetical protein [Moorena sp. SIO4G3]|uniref:hypothetical protein n=1 Tax=Moorena sp. SIO4G3 TaxID=2607821 RepID=UPI00142C0E35|nr:hypothetical protein [Moorena sp. SIO4G3]NEO78993.1 hypothetical protein [Moorena sp. SIO4G3]